MYLVWLPVLPLGKLPVFLSRAFLLRRNWFSAAAVGWRGGVGVWGRGGSVVPCNFCVYRCRHCLGVSHLFIVPPGVFDAVWVYWGLLNFLWTWFGSWAPYPAMFWVVPVDLFGVCLGGY